jgi:pyruvate,orthophosphate dikinase
MQANARQSVETGPTVGLQIGTNAARLADLKHGIENGGSGVSVFEADGVFSEKHRNLVWRFLTAKSDADKEAISAELGSLLATEFGEVFRAGGDVPVYVRLVDSVTQFLPDSLQTSCELAKLTTQKQYGKDIQNDVLNEKKELLMQIRQLSGSNPGLGLRGARLAVVFPEFLVIQLKAIIEGACIASEKGANPKPGILVPTVSHEKEIARIRLEFEKIRNDIVAQRGSKLTFRFGVMIGTPRAALIADKFASGADFIVIGTDNLTELDIAYGNNDETSLSSAWEGLGHLGPSPFSHLDEGIARLMEVAVKNSRAAKNGIEIGVSGGHAADDHAVGICHKIGVNWISCSPDQIPTVRVGAAQAVLRDKA